MKIKPLSVFLLALVTILNFRAEIPLNIVEMPAGAYTITVNAASTTLELPVRP